VPEGVERQHAMDVFLSNLAAAAAAAAAEGITLTLEAVSRERNPAWIFHRLDEVQAVIRAVGRDNLKIVFDTFHVQTEEGNLFDRLSANFAQIGMIQIGNPPDRHEPGVGELDLLSFLAELDRLGWNDWVSCEHIPSRGTLASLAWAAPFGISVTAESLAAVPPAGGRLRPIRSWRDMNKAN
jgi:hydroxypyruvate isomerase